jgi:hypothetical protein
MTHCTFPESPENCPYEAVYFYVELYDGETNHLYERCENHHIHKKYYGVNFKSITRDEYLTLKVLES